MLRTYGTLDIGEVPRFDFVVRLMPKPMKKRPDKRIKYLITNLAFGNF
jgi:hypothetical protein